MDVNVAIESTGEISRTIAIGIPRSEYETRVSSRLKRAAGQAQIKGFRAGKAPIAVVQKLYGGRIQSDVMGELIDKAFRQAIQDNELEVVGRPDFDVSPLEDDRDLQVTVKVELYPRPQISNYEGIELELEKTTVTDESVDKHIDELLDRFAQQKEVSDRQELQSGDIAEVSYRAVIGEKVFDENENVRIELGAGSYPEELEKALVGGKLGETREVLVPVPENIADPDVAGREALYSVSIKRIFEKIRPQLTEEFIKEKELGESLEDVQGKVRESLEQQSKNRFEQERDTLLFEKIIEANPFEMPQAIVDEEIRQILFEARLLDPSKEESFQFDMSQFRERLGKGAEFRARRRIVLERLIDQQDIKVEKGEVVAWLGSKAEEMERSQEEVEKLYDYPNSTSRLMEMITIERATEHLIGSAKITVKEV